MFWPNLDIPPSKIRLNCARSNRSFAIHHHGSCRRKCPSKAKAPHKVQSRALTHRIKKDDILEEERRGPPSWRLGCTFRLSFRFWGCRNPGQDSCSGRIPAESGRNIPDVPPFLWAGTLLPFWTGKRSVLFDRNPLMFMRRSFHLLPLSWNRDHLGGFLLFFFKPRAS